MIDTSSTKVSKPTTTVTPVHSLPHEFSVRWWNYICMAIFSLISFGSIISLLELSHVFTGGQRVDLTPEVIASLIFGVVSFFISCIILILDLANSKHPKGGDPGKYLDMKNMSKPVEGYLLVFFCIWWIGGTVLMTKPDGIAYWATNIYLSSWACFFLSFYTLNDWTTEKEIISFQQLTHLSWTLNGWFCLFFTSIVAFSTIIALYSRFNELSHSPAVTTMTLIMISVLFSAFWILAHYKLIGCCCCDHDIKVGGLFELSVGVFLAVAWMVILIEVTTYGSIAPTINGSCGQNHAPGSNMYLSSWTSFFAALYIVKRWKTERAMQFAQTEEEHIKGLAGRSATGQVDLGVIGGDFDDEI